MKVLIIAIGVAILFYYPEARKNTANFLRSTADFLSSIERTIEKRSSKDD
tara:strand:- start:276 stop:425 length:150 start_codon:yes stop_codon:yes gene_type:complete